MLPRVADLQELISNRSKCSADSKFRIKLYTSPINADERDVASRSEDAPLRSSLRQTGSCIGAELLTRNHNTTLVIRPTILLSVFLCKSFTLSLIWSSGKTGLRIRRRGSGWVVMWPPRLPGLTGNAKHGNLDPAAVNPQKATPPIGGSVPAASMLLSPPTVIHLPPQAPKTVGAPSLQELQSRRRPNPYIWAPPATASPAAAPQRPPLLPRHHYDEGPPPSFPDRKPIQKSRFCR
ncbi:hypothetical protein BDK51DRAFT_38185 [Blyttiomyces helicus]|uniref:Uncharacterized protein n=1 Tax=Blyttiomyces helicus TaxID=388810 RepID=A0A4P9W998_9FUNG|nr:hypothetical protein BDK51DRAFT_38185 [Blyttiomyces helicus]|eukprot:RKO88732.1 hypothetical protein BDK51DRAFT_38185 [Blyttiomyces helicus]